MCMAIPLRAAPRKDELGKVDCLRSARNGSLELLSEAPLPAKHLPVASINFACERLDAGAAMLQE